MKQEHPVLREGQVWHDSKLNRWLLITHLYEWKPGHWRVQAKRVTRIEKPESETSWSLRLQGPVVYRWGMDYSTRSRPTVEMNAAQILVSSLYRKEDENAFQPQGVGGTHAE